MSKHTLRLVEVDRPIKSTPKKKSNKTPQDSLLDSLHSIDTFKIPARILFCRHNKQNTDKYWIEIMKSKHGKWYWHIKCCNGRIKAVSSEYSKHSLCFNDAEAFAKFVDLDIR